MEFSRLAAAMFERPGQSVAVEFAGRNYDWAWMSRVSAQLAAVLAERGVPADAPLGVVARNRPAFAAVLLALMAQGRSIVMIYALQSANAIAADIAKLDLAAVVADPEDWTEAPLNAAITAGTLGISATADAATPISAAAGTQVRGPHRGAPDEPGIELLSSGTTGAPKRLPLSYRLVEQAMVRDSIVPPGHGAEAAAKAPAYVFAPFGNIAGIYTMLPALAGGTSIVLAEKFTIASWHAYLLAHKPKATGLPPAGYTMLFDADIPVADLACLEVVHSGSSRLDEAMIRKFEAHYGVPVTVAYGATEFAGPVTSMTLELRREFGDSKLASVGRPCAGAALHVVDADSGAELATDEVGLLEVMAPRIGPQWIRTTDLARIDADGFLYILGRADGAIIRGGFKVLPDIVASALEGHPSVAEACVVPLDDARLGQIPVAAVELRTGAAPVSEEELRAFARDKLYAMQVPVRIMVVDALPRTPSLKVRLGEVAALFREG